MSRSPLTYPLNRGIDTDGGGAGDLQTDVMRFMAILSLCLVAIFALVQSIPTDVPAEVPELPERAAGEFVPARALPEPRSPKVAPSAHAAMATPGQQLVPAQPVPIKTPPTPATEIPASQPVAHDPPATPAEPEAFTLRFESDSALMALVAKEEVGVYAIIGSEANRMSLDRGQIGFWQASVPKQYHEMDSATVPKEVRIALRHPGERRQVTWGVTLPGRLASQLERHLVEAKGGELIIAADGRLRLQ